MSGDVGALEVVHYPTGEHEIAVQYAGSRVILLVVRAVGRLEFGHVRSGFSDEWVPQLVEALQLGQRIGSRTKPWEPWPGSVPATEQPDGAA